VVRLLLAGDGGHDRSQCEHEDSAPGVTPDHRFKAEGKGRWVLEDLVQKDGAGGDAACYNPKA